MDSFLQSSAHQLIIDMGVKFEVFNVVREMIDDIEEWDSQNEQLKLQIYLKSAESLNDRLIKNVRSLQRKNVRLKEELVDVKTKAADVRSQLLSDIGPFLYDSFQSKKLKDKIQELEEEISTISAQYAEVLAQQPLLTSTIDNAADMEAHPPSPNLHAKASAETTTDFTKASDVNEAGQAVESAGVSDNTEVDALVVEQINEAGQTEANLVTKVAKKKKKIQVLFFYDLKDESLLEIFSFLQTHEVLYTAQVCRFMYKRVDGLFGIDSQIITTSWGERPKPPSADDEDRSTSAATTAGASSVHAPAAASVAGQAQQAAAALPVASPPIGGTFSFFGGMKVTGAASVTGGAALGPPSSAAASAASALVLAAANSGMAGTAGSSSTDGSAIDGSGATTSSAPAPALTKEVVDELIKKLSASELKVIMSLAERCKKQVGQMEALQADKDDLNERMMNTESVRNFLIEKLKAAEKEIKSLMTQNSTLRKQSASDQEIIAYLDLKGHEWEVENAGLQSRCNHLQASLDLQIGSHSHKEQQLTSELEDYKLKYEKLDSTFKTQKKLLIKEVKSLRAQVELLSTERSLQANQFRMLKEALSLPISAAATATTATANTTTPTAAVGIIGAASGGGLIAPSTSHSYSAPSSSGGSSIGREYTASNMMSRFSGRKSRPGQGNAPTSSASLTSTASTALSSATQQQQKQQQQGGVNRDSSYGSSTGSGFT